MNLKRWVAVITLSAVVLFVCVIAITFGTGPIALSVDNVSIDSGVICSHGIETLVKTESDNELIVSEHVLADQYAATRTRWRYPNYQKVVVEVWCHGPDEPLGYTAATGEVSPVTFGDRTQQILVSTGACRGPDTASATTTVIEQEGQPLCIYL